MMILRILFQDNDFCTVLSCHDTGCCTGAAETDDHNISLSVPLGGKAVLRGRSCHYRSDSGGNCASNCALNKRTAGCYDRFGHMFILLD